MYFSVSVMIVVLSHSLFPFYYFSHWIVEILMETLIVMTRDKQVNRGKHRAQSGFSKILSKEHSTLSLNLSKSIHFLNSKHYNSSSPNFIP